MTIGSSIGAFYKDEFHEVAADWIKPEETDDGIVVTPPQQRQNKALEDVEMQELGGIEINNEIPVYEMNGEQAKARLGALLRDKASSKKAGVDVDGSDYMFYNSLIRQLRDHLKTK